MNTYKILESEIEDLKIASLPKRPTAPITYGGKGYTAQQMKAAFDKIPLLLVERFNSLISDIEREGEGSIADDIKTGLFENHALKNFFDDVKNGNLSSYLTVGDASLIEKISQLCDDVNQIKEALNLS